MLRSLFTLLSALSLLLCVATVVLWVWSFGQIKDLTVRRDSNGFEVVRIWRGMLLVRHTDTDPKDSGSDPKRALKFDSWEPPSAPFWSTLSDIDVLTGRFRATSRNDWGPIRFSVVSDSELARSRLEVREV